MKLFIQFNESETNHLLTLENGQSFGNKADKLELKVFSEGENLRIGVAVDETFSGRNGIRLACDVPKSSIKPNENILLSMDDKMNGKW